jgi:hypothetical protein
MSDLAHIAGGNGRRGVDFVGRAILSLLCLGYGIAMIARPDIMNRRTLKRFQSSHDFIRLMGVIAIIFSLLIFFVD